jgi:heterodisulfide reductase subunit A
MSEEYGHGSGNVDDRCCDITYSSKGVKRVMLEVGRANNASAVLVVGGGVAGMHASLTLAEAGVNVFLVDSSPTCGGLVTLLDRTFPTASCGVCNMAISEQAYCPMIEVSRHPLITLMTDSRVKSVQGEAGNFTVAVGQKGEYVRRALCDSCGKCEAVCPVEVDVPAHTGMLPHKAIYRPGHRSLPGVFVLDDSACDRCGKCVEACPRGAINLDAKPCDVEVSVSAVIAGPGLGHYDPLTRKEYGYGCTENVITGLELERLLSPSGPTGGRLIRGPGCRIPRRIAFVQCIGSRDRAGEVPYCSAVCCMYAIKEAMKLKELMPDAVVKVFFIDIRACGKGFEEYYEKAKGLGVEFVPCRVSCVEPGDEHVYVSVETDGAVSREEFDLAVLSTGFTPPDGIDELSQALGIEKGLFGYLGSDVTGFSPVATEREGIYVCGGGVEPQDIPTAIMWSGACAFHALKDVLTTAGSPCAREATPMPKPGPIEIADDVESDEREPDEERIGVFVCRCKPSMDGLDIDKIVKWAKEQDQVVTAMEIPDMCMDRGVEALLAGIKQDPVDKVIIAGCSPRDVALLVEEGLQEVGIKKGFLEVANIREQCAWPHMDDESATEKALDLVAMAIEQTRHGKPLTQKARPVPEGALVIGGGIAGMRAAKALADLGHKVSLVEKAPVLGGRACSVKRSLSGMDVQALVNKLSEEVRQDPLIEVHVSSEVSRISRVDGGFRATIQSREAGSQTPRGESECGVVILATGGTQAEPPKAFTGQVVSGVVTQTEFEAELDQAGLRLEDLPGEIRTVVMIQCAGSRDAERPHCSRVCCLQALKNAIRMKTCRPETEVYILHRDMRAPGFYELFYEQAREMGVVFIRYPENAVPQLLPGDSGKPVLVEVYDEGLGELLHIPADFAVLSVGVEGSGDADLASGLGIDFDSQGFYTEANIKARPTDFLTPGVYVCGTARAPTAVREALISAEAAAVRAAVRLRRGVEHSRENTSNVRARLCRGCGICVEVCPYDARSLDEDLRVAVVDEFRCQGCGACQVACPGGAAEHLGFEALRLLAALDVAFS